MTLLCDFARVSERHPCLICERPDWCLIARGNPPTRAICARVESRFRWGEAGWLHRLQEDDGRSSPSMRRFSVPVTRSNTEASRELFVRSRANLPVDALTALAITLKVSVNALERLEAGVLTRGALAAHGMHLQTAANSFPMRDSSDNLIGIRLRVAGGKFAVTGSRNGLLIPRRLPTEINRLLIGEGESDVAALLDLGLESIGRPGCQQAVRHSVQFVELHRPSEVVIVADNDNIGRRGAEALARQVRSVCRAVKIICPPSTSKDMRAWKIAGASRADVDAAIETAARFDFSIRSRRLGMRS